jgi:Secretion system C-terminal sorting domain/Trypsin
MKKIVTLFTIGAALFANVSLFAQDAQGGTPYSFDHQLSDKTIAAVSTPDYDYNALMALSAQRVKDGTYELTDKLFDVNFDVNNSGTWTTLDNGDRLWKIKITSASAVKMKLYFQNFSLPEGAKLYVYNEDRSEEAGAFTSINNEDANLNEGIISTPHLLGETQIVEYYEPAVVKGQGRFNIFRVAHQFKSIASAESCQIDINCPDGTNWQNEKKGVVRIYVVIGSLAGYCSGSLVNNTAQDCKKYILTAMHCALDETTGVETTAYNQWIFYFNYEKTGCATGTSSAAHTKTGCTKKAGANDGGGSTGSDFLLIEMSSATFPTGVTPYYNGWTKASTVTAGGVGIHHPEGDVKKISTYTATPSSTSWGGTVANTHYQFVWGSGHGSTEPGSSGSPVFNTNHLIFGHLTGGGSCCVVNSCPPGSTGTGPTLPDAYGKVSYDWTSNGTTAAKQLKPWLDPTNSGVTTLAGAFLGCSVGITNYSNELAFDIFPNPNNGIFNLSLKLEQPSDIKINVLNLLGQTVSSKKISNSMGGTFELDLTAQPQGIYFVEITANGNTTVRKVNVIK